MISVQFLADLIVSRRKVKTLNPALDLKQALCNHADLGKPRLPGTDASGFRYLGRRCSDFSEDGPTLSVIKMDIIHDMCAV